MYAELLLWIKWTVQKKWCLVKSYCLKGVCVETAISYIYIIIYIYIYFYILQPQIAWNSLFHLNQTREYEFFKQAEAETGEQRWPCLTLLTNSFGSNKKIIGLADSQSSSIKFMMLISRITWWHKDFRISRKHPTSCRVSSHLSSCHQLLWSVSTYWFGTIPVS